MTRDFYAGHENAGCFSFTDHGMEVLLCSDLGSLDPARPSTAVRVMSRDAWEARLSPRSRRLLAGRSPGRTTDVVEAAYASALTVALLCASQTLTDQLRTLFG